MTNEDRAKEYAALFTVLGEKWRQCVPIDGQVDKHSDRMTVGGVTIAKRENGRLWEVAEATERAS